MPIYFHRKPNVNEVDNHKITGVTIDCNLSWSCSHVTASRKGTSKKNCQLSTIKYFLNLHARNYSFMPEFSVSTITDQRCENALKPLIGLHKRLLDLE